MGVDHGLAGKNNDKSRQRREKRAVKTKSIATKALTGGKKKEVIFDEAARVEWLTGFGKRKKERRKYGLAMEVLKKHKEHKEMVRSHRDAVKETKDFKSNEADEESADDDEAENDNINDNGIQIYNDPSTVSMFGSTVNVVIADNLAQLEEEDNVVIHKPTPKTSNKHELTRMEKALKKAKSMLGKKKKHVDNSFEGRNRSKEIRNKAESSKLLYKATGTYKGSKKGKKHK